ncbi:STAS domain-containing protein [Amycolatopsis sp. NPDC051071]|uniref:STAS domain-containing protein n=1 Tax=Amycolatopsis sp. NPDC051071 TaxID=3154637 RepID=UPI00342DB26F
MTDRLPFTRGNRDGPDLGTVLSTTVPQPRPSAEHLLRVRRTQWSENLLVVSAEGEIDLATAGRLELELLGDLPAATVLDLTDVTFMGVAGLRVVESAVARGQAKQRWTGVVASTRPVLRLLQLFGVDTRIPLYRHLTQAVQAVPRP